MHVGHAHFSFKPLSVDPSLANSPPTLQRLSPLSDPTPSPPLPSNAQCPRTRLASGSVGRPSHRRRGASDHAVLPPASTAPTRRVRPLACMSSNANANAPAAGAKAQNSGGEKGSKADAWKVGGTQQKQQQRVQAQQIIDFPPKHVVLHPDDANNKVFLAMGRALMSVNNCAMTIKDLAELSVQHGLVCQNVSAASQAITFFIRSHLHRCEVEQDFPLLLRHVLSGTPKDDALAPALYSRTGGNVSNKDKMARDENGNLKERPTCFRRGTTVWYLSRAVGCPCPFARAGIALRDYAEASAITSVEGRKVDGDSSRGMKRKRERNLRRRAGSGPAARRDDEDDDSDDEGRKPPKIKLTLRLRPCLTSLRDKSEEVEEDSSSSSNSDSDSDVQDELMDLDSSSRSDAPPPEESSAPKCEPTWTFPPFPIQRRISIPPYTPSEEIYPTIYTSPTSNFSTSAYFSEWSALYRPKLKLECVDSPPLRNRSGSGGYERAASVPFSVASPPPESDEEFGFDDDDEDDDVSFSMSPEVKFKREDELTYVWPQAAPSTSSLDLAHIKLEPGIDDHLGAGSSKRSSTHTIKQEKPEELDLGIAALNLSFGEDPTAELPDSFGLSLKHEDGLINLNEGLSWGHPVDLTQYDPVEPSYFGNSYTKPMDDASLKSLWKDVELLGPDTVRLQDLDDGSWDEGRDCKEVVTSSPSGHRTRTPLEQHDEDAQRPISQSPEFTFDFRLPGSPAFTLGSLSPPPSLAGSVQTWSACSPETEIESAGPASPPSFASPEAPTIVRADESSPFPHSGSYEIGRTTPWTITGKSVASTTPSRQAVAVRSDDIPGIPLSEDSAPWERGMYGEEDVEKHLLDPAQPLMSIMLPARGDASIENSPPTPEPPLSPQEEAVFQSLCICPDMSWEGETQTDAVKPAEDVPKVHESHVPNASFTSVLAAATRPTMRLRERRPSKRPTEVEHLRKQAEVSRSKARNTDAGSDSDGDTSGPEVTLRRREKPGTTVNNVDNKGTLRRSKRVANVVAMQRNRERLRKRTTS